MAAWRDTRDTLHLWTQIVGKIRLALTPWLNHSWHVALYVTARGLTTSPMPCTAGALPDRFRFSSITCCGSRTSDGDVRKLLMRPVSVAAFYADMMIALSESRHRRHDQPRCPAKSRTPFRSPRTTVHTSYDADYGPAVSGAC